MENDEEENINTIICHMIYQLENIELKPDFQNYREYITTLSHNLQFINENLDIRTDELYSLISLIESEQVDSEFQYFNVLRRNLRNLKSVLNKMSVSAYRKRIKTPLPKKIKDDRDKKSITHFIENVNKLTVLQTLIENIKATQTE